MTDTIVSSQRGKTFGVVERLGLYPQRDQAFMVEVGPRVGDAVRKETSPELRLRYKAIRSRTRRALGEPPGPASSPKKIKAATPDRSRRERTGGIVYVAESPRLAHPSEPSLRVEAKPRPQPVPGERMCHACLREDADQRDQWAKQLASRGNHLAAGKESAEAERLRALLSAPNQDCRFHSRRAARQRRSTPEPTIRPPGIVELARMEEAQLLDCEVNA